MNNEKGRGPIPLGPGGRWRWALQHLCACRTFCPTIQCSWIRWRVSVHLLWSGAHVWEDTCASFAHRQQTQEEAPLSPQRGWPVLALWPFRQCMTNAWIVDQPTWRWKGRKRSKFVSLMGFWCKGRLHTTLAYWIFSFSMCCLTSSGERPTPSWSCSTLMEDTSHWTLPEQEMAFWWEARMMVQGWMRETQPPIIEKAKPCVLVREINKVRINNPQQLLSFFLLLLMVILTMMTTTRRCAVQWWRMCVWERVESLSKEVRSKKK